MTTTHQIVSVEASEASEPGALSGHVAICSCGYRMSTSLSADEAARQGSAHVAYMARKVAR
jgi:hypothetical protein